MRVLTAIALVAIAGSASASPRLEHVTDTKDGIAVYAHMDKKKQEGVTLARGVIRAPLDKVWTVLIDLDRYVTFMPYMQASRVVKRTDKHVWQYCRTDTPVVSDRDYTLKFTVKKAAGSGESRIDWVIDNAAGPPPVDGVVRVQLATGSWRLKPVNGGKHTQFKYRLNTSPGGSIPLWVAHLGNKRAIPDIIRAVRKKLGVN